MRRGENQIPPGVGEANLSEMTKWRMLEVWRWLAVNRYNAGMVTRRSVLKGMALGALGLEQAGMHAFRRGCNRRWELAGVKPAVIRQQMGHSSSAMTDRYTGEIPLDDVRAEFSMKFGNKIDVLETMETGAAA